MKRWSQHMLKSKKKKQKTDVQSAAFIILVYISQIIFLGFLHIHILIFYFYSPYQKK